MESPVSFQADEIRNKKTDVLQAVRPIPRDRLGEFAVRGQYGAGEGEGRELLAYRHEPNVDADSATETYVALKLFVDNWRWQGVPFYLRTGKSLPTRVSEVVVQFRPVPHRAFPAGTAAQWLPNCLVLHIQPQEDIILRFQVKEPGPDFRLRSVSMNFDYGSEFSVPTPEAYETLLADALEGDATLHMRADQVEAAWAVVEPILEGWAETPPADFPNYPAGSWGPEAADALLARDGHKWLPPASNANAANKPGPQGHAAT
jgi:glucose-6-phosphate 1-dehydrogenase